MGNSNGKEEISEDLLCPVCFELPNAEVYQCRDGHLLCSTCYFKLEECPQCRDPLDRNRPIRCRTIERIIDGLQVSCTFKSNGCKTKLPKGSTKDHEEGCCYDFKKFGEFVSICKIIGYPKCQFKFNGASTKQAVDHFVAEHGCISTNSESIKMELTSFKESVKVYRNGLQYWTPIIADLKERKCLLLTMAVLNKKHATFGIISFFVRYSATENLVGSPVQLKCTIVSRAENESLTSFHHTPMDALKVNKYVLNREGLPLYAPCFTTSCNAEGSLTITCRVKKHKSDNSLVSNDNDTHVCLAKSVFQNFESVDF